MTLVELAKRLSDEFGINKVPDYMKGVDFTLLCLAKPLWAIENNCEKDMIRECIFDLVVNLPASRYYTSHGGRYLELYQRALQRQKPFTFFITHATNHARQQMGMLTYTSYIAMINGDTDE